MLLRIVRNCAKVLPLVRSQAGTHVSDSPKRFRLCASTVGPGPIRSGGDKRSQLGRWRTAIQTTPRLETFSLGRFALLAMTCARCAGIAAREGLTTSRREMAPQRLERLNPRREMVWSRKPRTHNIWYPVAPLTMGDSG